MPSPTLTDKVSEMIVQDILNGLLQPDEKLVVADLKQRYNVGASPIREALVQLSWSKHVNLQPQKGCSVASISLDELNDLYQSLRFVSAVLLKQAIESEDESWELAILTCYHKLSRLHHAKEGVDSREWEERQHQFLIALMEGSQSPNMLDFFNTLLTQIKRYRCYALTNGLTQMSSTLDDYEIIMKLVLAKDTKQAIKKLDEHLDLNRQQTHAVIEQQAAAA
ncbi:XRE family transcriptional regulator [Vibrio galatheae]|uniref:XRE family transcriptional regulator n=1 Tax=Vibrio galatheae TaxID=579748 RepID=A0A0F4NN96_9VIBR|nr:GntR family transcriptional regulator [Vibrio galatheae]KJY83551.1 XRE family transcriptional regulator [Vibrio galatheae]